MHPLIQHALSRNLYTDLILWDPSPESDTTGSAQCYHTYNHAQLLIFMGISTGSGFIHSWTYTKPQFLLSLNLHEATDSSLHDILVFKEKNLFGVLVLASYIYIFPKQPQAVGVLTGLLKAMNCKSERGISVSLRFHAQKSSFFQKPKQKCPHTLFFCILRGSGAILTSDLQNLPASNSTKRMHF